MPNRPKTMLPHVCRLIQAQFAADLTDGQLLERFLDGHDAEAFAALVRRHGRTVLGVCQRVLNNAHDAEDAFQATFLVLVQKARSITRREALGSWLYGVAYRVARKVRAEAMRRHQHERQVPGLEAESAARDPWEEVRPIIDEEVNRLPEKYRRPILLCYFEGKTYGETARLLGWPPGTASVRLARARALLRARLTRRGVALSAGALAVWLLEGTAPAAEWQLLADLTVRAAVQLAAGRGAVGVSTQVIALTQGVVKAMLLRKLKTLAGVLLAVGLTCGGAGYWGRFAGTAPATAAAPPSQVEAPEAPATPAADPLVQAPPGEAKTSPARPFLLPTTGGGRPAQTRIGLIHLSRVFKGAKKFQAVQADLRTRTQQMQKQHDVLKAQLQQVQVEIDNPAVAAGQRERLVRQKRQLQRQMEDDAEVAKSELTKLSDDAIVRMYREVAEAAQKIANAQGLELVLFYNDAVTEADFYQPANLQRKLTQPGALMPMVVAPGMDITATVISALNLSVAAPKVPEP